MTHLLDSNTAIERMRGRNPHVQRRMAAAPAGSVVVCSVVVGELRFGAEQSADPPAEHAKTTTFLSQYFSLPYDGPAAEQYALIRADLERVGQRIGQLDMQIAAIARSHGLIVVTHNTRDFGRVPGLQIEDWQLP